MPDGQSGADGAQPPEPVLARPADDDHDLLTYGEVGARISEEVAAERGVLESLEQRLAAGEDVAATVERSRLRLERLREAGRRNSRQPITDANFEKVFGYTGVARRNT
jgi:ribosomal protein S12 methylthiotransferase accessory factor YcaO